MKANMKSPLLLLFSSLGLFPFLVATVVPVHASSAPFASFGFSKATLLSGSVGECIPSPNVSTCSGGISSAMAVFRSEVMRLGSENDLFIGYFDKDTAFVQMHPHDYGVNVDVFRAFGLRYYHAEPTAIANAVGRPSGDMFSADDVRMLQANIDVSPDHPFSQSVDRQAILFNNTIGLVIVGHSHSAASMSASRVLQQTIKYLRSRVAVIVVFNLDVSVEGPSVFDSLASHPPDVFIDMISGADTPCAVVGGVSVCGARTGTGVSSTLNIYLNSTGDGLSHATITTHTITKLFSSNNTALDATYYEHQAVMAHHDRLAAAYDPVVGTANVRMPSGGRWDSTYPCYAGECPQATLYGRALLQYIPDADVSFASSGGFRGRGWAPGNIRMSNIWEMCPYMNQHVRLRVLGYKIWQLLELSASSFLGESVSDSAAGRSILGENFRMEIDMTRPRFTSRLLSAKIRNRTTGEFEDLVRTRYYIVATDDYVFKSQAAFAPIFQQHYDGEETTYPYGTDSVQTSMAAMLTATSPYDNLLSGIISLYRGTAERTLMAWIQTASNCTEREYWVEGIVSCVACPQGYVRATDGINTCVPQQDTADSSKTGVIIAVAVPIILVVLVAALVGVFAVECMRRKNTRNTDDAPKSGDDITIIFTDIESSTKLWGTVPASMAAALETHHRVIRECIASFKGYEVKTIGDSFMIAMSSAESAVSMAVCIQERLAAEAWPCAIFDVYACKDAVDEAEKLDLIGDDPARKYVEGEAAERSLRVRIGVNTGAAEAVFDEVSKGYDYYGPAVNLAARIEAAAQGGQILASRGTVNKLPPSTEYSVSHFTDTELQGIMGKTELLQVTPTSLPGRSFAVEKMAKKALAVQEEEEEGDAAVKAFFAESTRTGDSGAPTTTSNNEETQSKYSGTASQRPNNNAAAATKADEKKRFYMSMFQEALSAAIVTLNASSSQAVLKALCGAWRVHYSPPSYSSSPSSSASAQHEVLTQLAERIAPSLRRRMEALEVGGGSSLCKSGVAAAAAAPGVSPQESGGAAGIGFSGRRVSHSQKEASGVRKGSRTIVLEDIERL